MSSRLMQQAWHTRSTKGITRQVENIREGLTSTNTKSYSDSMVFRYDLSQVDMRNPTALPVGSSAHAADNWSSNNEKRGWPGTRSTPNRFKRAFNGLTCLSILASPSRIG